MDKTGFLFDLDGVLIDSEKEYTRIWQRIGERFPTGFVDFAIRIKGQTLPEILGTYYPPELHGEVTDMLNEMEQRMHYDYLPGARETLEILNSMGLGCALVTSSNEVKMRHLREELPELEGYFGAIVTADKISRSKPDPEGYLLGARLLGADPCHCAVFEDSAQGARAGRAAGAYVVGLTTTLPESDIRAHCDRIAATLADIDINEIVEILDR